MLNYLRYASATFCFSASVGCLALWWQFSSDTDLYCQLKCPSAKIFTFEATGGIAVLGVFDNATEGFAWFSTYLDQFPGRYRYPVSVGLFGVFDSHYCFFPLWYPALIFALAGVGVLRVSRQFSIRSALVCLTVVAALLGMAVVL